MAEWLKAHDWKSCGLTPAWVRIPPRPCWDDPFRFRGVAQSGRALRSGRRGPRFESGRPDYVGRLSDLLEERWQNGIALASKASARKGLGVRIPRAPFMGPQRPLYPSSQELVGFFIGSVKAELLADRKTLALKAFHWQIDQVRTLW